MYDVIVIGAGQAGLSMGYYLQQAKLSFLVIDRVKEIGEVWRKRYDSLTLFTPRSYSSLPGMDLMGDEKVYPTKDEIADYLVSYVKEFALPVQLETTVKEVVQVENGFKIVTSSNEMFAKNVVIATGPFQNPFIPSIAGSLSDEVLQIHSSEYQNPKQLNEGSVLVVGGGNSGAQIAVELSKKRDVYLSVSQKPTFLPQDLGGKSIFWWCDKAGILKANAQSKIGRKLRSRPDPIFGYELRTAIKEGHVTLLPRTTHIQNDSFEFQGGRELRVRNVIWATGFKADYRWIKIPDLVNEDGYPIQNRGITNKKGLYFLGLPWQYRRGSALLQGVGYDADYLIQHLLKKEG